MKQKGARGTAKTATPRRRRLPRRWRRAASWLLLVIATLGVYGVLLASRTPAAQSMLTHTGDRIIAATAALGLVVTDIEVEGRETTDPATVLAALAAVRGTPILSVSPARAKQQLERLPWVRSATIERRLPGTLFIRLVERHPLALWQHGGRQQLIDRDGTVIPIEDLSRFAGLPIVVGEDAAANAAVLIDMLSSEPTLAARVSAAIRVGGRRWNLRMDDTIDVLLPEEKPELAWHQLAELERMRSLLQRDVRTVDLRLPDRLVLRVNAAPAPQVGPGKKPHSGKAT